VLFGQIPRPRTVRGDAPKDLERVTMKLLERDLPARYATAEEALGELMNCADAPRTGREALVTVLGERFPDSAPVRQSRAHGRSRETPPTPAPGALPVLHTVTSTVSGPVSSPMIARPGLGTVMSATTGTIQAPRRMLVRALILLAVTIACGVVAFVIVSAARHRSATGAYDDSGSGAADATHVVPASAPQDAAPPDAPAPPGKPPR
jgi:multisubunit Na+/H+ antiporter MnhC subunit